MGHYTYDAWGNILSIIAPNGAVVTNPAHLMSRNPLRYRGYYYDTETGFYYVSSRYYDPEIGRFINTDDIDYLGADGSPLSYNLFAYCGNNPVIREDSGGNFWLISIAVGMATRYIGDVLLNIMDDKTGVEIFELRSSWGEYIAAGVTALIPGTGLGGALVRNIATEVIIGTENTILGKEVNVTDSIVKIGVGTVLDAGFERVTNKAIDYVSSKMPQNYSSYAHTARQSDSNLTREQIYRSMQRSIRVNRFFTKAIAFTFDLVRSILPY